MRALTRGGACAAGRAGGVPGCARGRAAGRRPALFVRESGAAPPAACRGPGGTGVGAVPGRRLILEAGAASLRLGWRRCCSRRCSRWCTTSRPRRLSTGPPRRRPCRAPREPPPPPPPPLPRTKWTRRVPHPVLIGHVASLFPPTAAAPCWGGRARAARCSCTAPAALLTRQCERGRSSPPPPSPPSY